MQIIDDRALLLSLRNPDRVTSVIPKSERVPDSTNEVIVYWGLDEVVMLKNLKIKGIPSPIEKRYQFTGKYKPFDHQIKTAGFLTLHKRAFCFNEQGTGKTASAIWAADYLMNIGKVHRVLVVCPLSIMDSAWRNDLFTFALHRTTDVAYGSRKQREKIIANNSDFVVINYDGIEVVEQSIAEGQFDLIIIDEATYYKNPQTKRWKTLNRLVQPTTRLWMMTGTPAAQSPVDAYGLAKMINPQAVPRFAGSFRDMVMTKVSQFRWIPKPDATTTVHRVLQPAIRFTKDQCLDLPDIVYTRRHVELTRQQKKYYNLLRDKLKVAASGEEVTAVNAAVSMNKLLQISAGAVYTDDGDTLQFDISSRYKVLKEVINETTRKVLVFVPFKNVIELLADALRADNITTELIFGAVPAKKRTEIFHKFETSSDPQVLLIQPQAASHGVTLVAADTVVWWGPTPSLETYAQANARVHRTGQRYKCTVVQLEGSAVEKRMYAMLDNKIDVHTKIVDLYKELLD